MLYIICKQNPFSYWTLYGFFNDVGKVLYKYCTSTFHISTLTIMFMHIMWSYIYEYHLSNCFAEINSVQCNSMCSNLDGTCSLRMLLLGLKLYCLIVM